MRRLTAILISPIIAITGNYFSKTHRWQNNWVYKLIDTGLANQLAVKMRNDKDFYKI